jgi:hypothetical protein
MLPRGALAAATGAFSPLLRNQREINVHAEFFLAAESSVQFGLARQVGAEAEERFC